MTLVRRLETVLVTYGEQINIENTGEALHTDWFIS